MRIIHLATPAVLALALAACASNGGQSHYQSEFERLSADCTARGGILSPTGSQSGRPQLDNVCKVTAQPSNR